MPSDLSPLEWLALGLGFTLVYEGMIYGLFAERIPAVAAQIAELPPIVIRLFAIFTAVGGLMLIALVRGLAAQ